MEAPCPSPSSVPETELLRALSANAVLLLEAVRVPAYIVDCHRRVRWQNQASLELVGDLRGRLDASVGLDPEELARAREAFARKMNGAAHTELELSVSRPDGTRLRVAVSSVPLLGTDGVMIGSFGLVRVLEEVEPMSDTVPALSPRERETLAMLVAGHSTAQMAEQMDLSTETVRNYVKRLLRTIGASSRVEAVAKARQLGLV
jgi:DNA-binding CsgD family transcriptional regulator